MEHISHHYNRDPWVFLGSVDGDEAITGLKGYIYLYEPCRNILMVQEFEANGKVIHCEVCFSRTQATVRAGELITERQRVVNDMYSEVCFSRTQATVRAGELITERQRVVNNMYVDKNVPKK